MSIRIFSSSGGGTSSRVNKQTYLCENGDHNYIGTCGSPKMINMEVATRVSGNADYASGNGTLVIANYYRINSTPTVSTYYGTPKAGNRLWQMPFLLLTPDLDISKIESIQIGSNKIILGLASYPTSGVIVQLNADGNWVSGSSTSLHAGFVWNTAGRLTKIILSGSCENFSTSYSSIIHTDAIPITINTYID